MPSLATPHSRATTQLHRNPAGSLVLSPQLYLQRGGRTARAGAKGVYISLLEGQNDVSAVRTIERHFYPEAPEGSVIQLVPPDEEGKFDSDILDAMIKEFNNDGGGA